jgi:hypothetical protein
MTRRQRIGLRFRRGAVYEIRIGEVVRIVQIVSIAHLDDLIDALEALLTTHRTSRRRRDEIRLLSRF